MPKYLLEVNYTLEGVRGIKSDGGTARKAVAQATAESVGGTVESFHFAFGGTDAYIVADLPDNVAAAAICLAVSSGGVATTRTTPLMTAEDVDAAAAIQVGYRPTGS
jgi:uncharacterized protein with GYD domain